MFVFLQAKLRASKQVRPTSITNKAGVQELDSSSHLCPVFPDELLPDPAEQWWQTLHFSNVKHSLKHSFVLLPVQICVSINAGSSAQYHCS